MHKRSENLPKFLLVIESNLDMELKNSLNYTLFQREEAHFKAFQLAFERVTNCMQTYGKFLNRIKLAYDQRMLQMQREINYQCREREKLLKDYLELQSSVLDQVDLDNKDLLPSETSEGISGNKALEKLRQRARLAHAQSKLDKLKQDKEDFELQISTLKKALDEEKIKSQSEADAKELMYTEYAELQRSFVAFKDVIKEQEDPEVLRLALDQSRRDLSQAQAQVNRFRHEFDAVVPMSEFDSLRAQLKKLESENSQLKKSESNLKKDKIELSEAIKSVLNHLERKRILEERHKLVDKARLTLKRYGAAVDVP